MAQIDAKEMADNLSLRIKKERKKRKITQEQMSEKLDISVREYQRYENREQSIPLLRINEIANTLDIELVYLLEGRHSIDLIIEKALMTMPDELLQTYMSELQDEVNKALKQGKCDRRIAEILIEIYDYGQEHRFDKNRREFDHELSIYTKFYEKLQLEQFINKIK